MGIAYYYPILKKRKGKLRKGCFQILFSINPAPGKNAKKHQTSNYICLRIYTYLSDAFGIAFSFSRFRISSHIPTVLPVFL